MRPRWSAPEGSVDSSPERHARASRRLARLRATPSPPWPTTDHTPRVDLRAPPRARARPAACAAGPGPRRRLRRRGEPHAFAVDARTLRQALAHARRRPHARRRRRRRDAGRAQGPAAPPGARRARPHRPAARRPRQTIQATVAHRARRRRGRPRRQGGRRARAGHARAEHRGAAERDPRRDPASTSPAWRSTTRVTLDARHPARGRDAARRPRGDRHRHGRPAAPRPRRTEIETETELVGEEARRRGRGRRRGRRPRRRRGAAGRVRGRCAWRPCALAAPVDWLVVGLGNPGHGVRRDPPQRRLRGGRDAARRAGTSRAPSKKYAGRLAEGRTGPGGPRVAVLLPQTYMNEAGRSVGPARGALKARRSTGCSSSTTRSTCRSARSARASAAGSPATTA